MKLRFTHRLLCVALLLGFAQAAQAQVSGLSYNIQPTVNYNWFDNQSGLDNGILYGGRVGLGFGENVELRALYMRSGGFSTDFGDFDFGDVDVDPGLDDRDVDITRYGGEVKLNLSRGRLLPYLTLGAGIQEFELDGGAESDNIYGAAGLGVTFSILDRFTLNVEGRNTSYTQNALRNLADADVLDDFDLDPNDFTSDRLYNWSLGVGLEFYLGGRRPGTLSDVDRAYEQAFASGFRGASILVEPTLTHINWDDKSNYVDTYLGGAALGVDFGPLVGARVFYYRAMEDDEVNFDFDDLQMYGADFRFRLSPVTTGLSPFITIGGGYIDVQEDYVNRGGTFGAESQGFASGGGGISLNITPNFRLTGTYRALLTSGTDIENIDDTDQIQTASQWTAGVNLAFGNRAKRPEAVFTSTADARVQAQRTEDQIKMQAALADQARKNAEATRELRQDYERRLEELNANLEQAKAANDSATVAKLEKQIDDAEDVVDELEMRADDYNETVTQAQRDSANLRETQFQAIAASNRPVNTAAPQQTTRQTFSNNQSSGTIALTPAELEGLIEEIFEGINAGLSSGGMLPPPPGMGSQPMQFNGGMGMQMGAAADTARVNRMERELNQLRRSVAELTSLQREARKEAMNARAADKAEIREEMANDTEMILKEIRDMRSDIANKANMTDKEKRQLDRRAAKEAEEAAKQAEKEAEEAAEAARKAARKAERKGN